jgi:hypothetical protein
MPFLGLVEMTMEQHRAIYGHLDPFAIAPFMERYGEALSPEARRQACLLQRAMHGRLPITQDIRIELAQFLSAGLDGRRYETALHHQQLRALLERYERRIKRRRDAEADARSQPGERYRG